ncbi:hypothetical protein GCM10028806_45530 [Spirosoma terrae]|uniref:Uncharacterized protein n=1 Tax=Spirosoma terrae TaxID=1968276 RepID=A0A6L9L637_9BACT|nr:hypothetical protein [Spirosoma terrae]NDU93778.1 hypothetical protein [Spirosoma terrae]
MDDFDKLKQVWQQQAVPVTKPDLDLLKQSNADHQRKLERPQLFSAISLFLTSAFILWMGFFSSITFQSRLTYVALALLSLVPAIQGVISLTVYNRLRRIDVTAPVTEHLSQWEQYYAFRQKMVRINLPVYYVLLNGAFGLYFIEMLGYFPLIGQLVALSLYVAWMLFAYFVLGKRALRKENGRLMSIIDNLKTIQQQLDDNH